MTSLAADATSQLNTLNCNNVNLTDLVDSDSNNSDTSSKQTRIKESFNETATTDLRRTRKGPDLTVRALSRVRRPIFTPSIA